MGKKLIFLFLFFLGNTFSFHVKAEYCDMVGCTGFRWIYIPRSQYQGNGIKELIVGSDKYIMDRSLRLFKEDKLPEINEIVTLNVNVDSFNELPSSPNLIDAKRNHWLKIKQVEANSLITDKENKIESINDHAYEGCRSGGRRGDWDLNKNMKLKIRSYQHVENILFGWVEIIEK